MATVVKPDGVNNTHHVKLSKAGQELGLILCDGRGNAEPAAFVVDTYPQSAIQMQIGRNKYADQHLPFSEIAWEDASGGRGKRDSEDDETRYADGSGVNTLRSGRVILGGLETYAQGLRTWHGAQPGSATWVGLYGENRNYATYFDCTVNHPADYVEISLRRVGSSAGSLTVELRADDSGPGAVLKSVTQTGGQISSDILTVRVKFNWSGTQALVAPNRYWIVVQGAANTNASNHWLAACNPEAGTKARKSADGTSWSAAAADLYFRVCDADAPFTPKLFDYQGKKWMVQTPDGGGNSSLWLEANGAWSQVLSDLGGVVTDVAVGGRFVYFARGASAFVLRFYDDGTGTVKQQAQEYALSAERLACIGRTLWGWSYGSRNFTTGFYHYASALWRATVPPQWGGLWWSRGEIVSTETVWDASDLPGASVGLESGLTTITIPLGGTFDGGLLAIKDLPAPVNITGGERIYTEMYSTVGGTGFSLVFSDLQNLGRTAPALWYLEGETFSDLEQARDRVRTLHVPLVWKAAGKIYVSQYRRFEAVFAALGTAKNTNTAGMTAKYWNGLAWASLTISDGTAEGGKTLAKSGSISFTPPTDWATCQVNNVSGYWIELSVDADLTQVDLQELELTLADYLTCPLPSLTASEWNWISLQITPHAYPLPNEQTIWSVGLSRPGTILGLDRMTFRGGIHIGTEAEYFEVPDGARVNAVAPYVDEITGETIPWLLTDRGVMRVVEGEIIPLPQDELAAISTERLGAAWCRNNTYLYFTLGERKVLRLYGRQIEDVGPDLGEGLPAERDGTPCALISFAGGKVALAIDGGASKFSSVLMRSNDGWHELYRAPRAGLRIRGISYQETGESGRIWINQGGDMLSIPYNVNPESDPAYPYTFEGHLVTGRIHYGRYDIEKFFNSLKLIGEQMSASASILVQQRTSAGGGWVNVGEFTSDSQEQNISPDYSASGRWMQFRYIFRTGDRLVSPVHISSVLAGLMRIKQVPAVRITFRLVDDDKDLQGNPEGLTARAKWDILESWMGKPEPVLMNCDNSLYDGRYVFIDDKGSRYLSRYYDADRMRHGYICQAVLLLI
jgi:hypothetical protein